MKHSILLILFVLLVSCNSKTEKRSGQEHVDTYINEAGEIKGDNYVIANLEVIKQKWEQSVQQALNSGTTHLTNFKIKQVATEGEAGENGYILTAETEDGMVSVATILELKKGKFYFEENPGTPRSYRVVICIGNCEKGCDPVVSLVDGVKILFCSSCPSCEKIDSNIL